MIIARVPIPDETAREYREDAAYFAKEFGLPPAMVSPEVIMSFALCAHDSATRRELFFLSMQVAVAEATDRPAE